ncbi:MAG: hypothetical protein AAF805_05790 [Planctomycetota bacterium]
MATRLRGLVAAAACAICSAGEALLIDDFSQGPFEVVSYGRPTLDLVQPFLDPAHTIGGERRWERVYHNESTPGADSFTQIRVDPSEGVFEFRSIGPERQSSGYFDLVYGSEGSPLEADLIADGADRLRFRFRGEGSTPWLHQVSVRAPRIDGGGTSGISWSNFARSVIMGTDPIIEFPIPEDPLIDLTRVESIRVSVIRYVTSEYFQLDKIETATEPLVGDYDRDGDVDAADYGAWRDQTLPQERGFFTGELSLLGFPVQGLAVDGNGDGFVNAADYTVWRDAVDASTPASVPEPVSVAALVVGAALIAARHDRG